MKISIIEDIHVPSLYSYLSYISILQINQLYYTQCVYIIALLSIYLKRFFYYNITGHG